MKYEQQNLSQLAITLINHFDSVYYVDINTGHYTDLLPLNLLRLLVQNFREKIFIQIQ